MLHAEYVMGGSSCKECISITCRIDGWLGARRKNVGGVEHGPTFSEDLCFDSFWDSVCLYNNHVQARIQNDML